MVGTIAKMLGFVSNEDMLRILHGDLGWSGIQVVSRDCLREYDTGRIERIKLRNAGCAVPDSVIVKSHLACDGRGLETWSKGRPGNAEAAVYRMLPECSWLPRLHWSGELADIGVQVEILEDAATWGTIPGFEYTWSEEDIDAVAEALANLHACAIRVGAEMWLGRCPWLATCGVGVITSGWLEKVAQRVEHMPVGGPREDIRKAMGALAARYDTWSARLRDWNTLLHGDLCPGNVALAKEGGGVRAVLLDMGLAAWGLPQCDMVYMSQRDWRCETDWERVQKVHYQCLRALVPAAYQEEDVYGWGSRLALLQLMLVGTGHVVDVYARWEEATERERRWAGRAPVFGPDVLALCQAVVAKDPWE